MNSYIRPIREKFDSAKHTLGMDKPHSAIQFIDRNGELNANIVHKFVKDMKLGHRHIDYVVVSVMGPQSSGKSTLLNNLFRTKFKEMEAANGRTQTTQGIWMDKCVDIQPLTIVMDLEGSDGRERGQDDTTFEKQSALFALAVSDIVIINMWCNEIGREQAANKPLLRAVFQAMMRMFGNTRKMTLLFVLRDKSKTPLEKLKPDLEEDIEKIWNEVPKRLNHKNTRLHEIFNVEVVALSNYERDEKMFMEEVAALRTLIVDSICSGVLASDRRGDVYSSGFSITVENVWKAIKEDRDLDLPSHKVMLANTRCEEILDQQLSKLIQDERWLNLKESAKKGLVPGLGHSLSKLLESYLHDYDNEASYFDETVMRSKRELLKSKVLEVLHPAFATTLVHLRKKVYQEFKSKLNASIDKGDKIFQSAHTHAENAVNEFDNGTADACMENANWDVSIVRDKLRSEIEAYANSTYHDIRFKDNKKLIADLKNVNLQNHEQSQEQIKKMLEMTEAQQKAAEEHIKKLEDLRARDLEKLNELMKLHVRDQAQVEKLQKNVDDYQKELTQRKKWGMFYFIRELFWPSDFKDTDEADEAVSNDATGTGETVEVEATGTGEIVEVEATGTGETIEVQETGNATVNHDFNIVLWSGKAEG